MIAVTVPSPAPKQKEPLNTWAMLGLVTEIGGMVAIPAFLFGFLGAYGDKAWGTSPLFVIIGLMIALTSSTIAIWHHIKPFLRS